MLFQLVLRLWLIPTRMSRPQGSRRFRLSVYRIPQQIKGFAYRNVKAASTVTADLILGFAFFA